MKQLDSKSLDIVSQNIEKIKELFPEVFSEGKINFAKLQEELGTFAEDEAERYNFTWAGKTEAKRIAQTPSTGTLRPCKEESKDWDTTQNLYIEGDNLEVLKLLQKSYHKQVKMIYIDPPYNTGKDFVYKDNFKDNIKNYLEITGQVDSEGNRLSTNSDTNGRYHSDWLSMMYPRLKLARNLLKDDGVIFISIDDNEVANLRKLCDEIFGEDNFVTELIWSLNSGTQAGYFTRSHETILVYAKNNLLLSSFKDFSGGTIKHGALKKISKVNPSSDILFPKGSIRCENQNVSFSGTIGGSEQQFIKGEMKFIDGVLANDVLIEAGWAMKNQVLSWLKGEETYDSKGQKVLRFYFNAQGILFYEKERGTQHPKTVLQSEKVGNTKRGGQDILDLFSEKIMDFPKPINLIEFLTSLIAQNENDMILDFFSGSATTAHAIMKLNSEDSGNRKYIMVQLPEPTDNKEFPTICEIGKERIRRAGEKIKTDNAGKDLSNLDIGFKVLKLDSSNIKTWDSNFENLEQNLLDSIENIKDDRTPQDLLYEILLKYGLDLTLPIEEKTLHSKKVFVIGYGALIVCLDDEITLEVVEAIAKLKDEYKSEITRVVFKDSSFADAVVKTNALQVLKQFEIDEVVSV